MNSELATFMMPPAQPWAADASRPSFAPIFGPTVQKELENLRRVLDVTRHLAVTNSLDALLTYVVDATCQVLECERATIFLYDARTDELFSRIAKGTVGIRFPAARGIAGACARARKALNIPDAYADARFNQEFDRRSGFRTRSLLTVPLENLDGELIGVLQAVNKVGSAFSTSDEELANVLAAQAGVALHRAWLLEQEAERQRLVAALNIARDIQQNLFPKENPSVAGYDIAGWNQPADETGGDAYDFISLPDGRLAIFLADATGHGIGAALVIAQCRSLLRAMLTVTQDLSIIVARVNRLLCDDLGDSKFVTAFLGILDPARHRLDYYSCGQGPILVKQGAAMELRDASAPPFAVLADYPYDPPEFVQFGPDDLLVLLTDGFYETANPAGELFGSERITGIVGSSDGLPADQLISQLNDQTQVFRADAKQGDDLTAVLVHRRA